MKVRKNWETSTKLCFRFNERIVFVKGLRYKLLSSESNLECLIHAGAEEGGGEEEGGRGREEGEQGGAFQALPDALGDAAALDDGPAAAAAGRDGADPVLWAAASEPAATGRDDEPTAGAA